MSKRSVPDWLLERLAKGELPEEQAKQLHADLAAAGESQRLDELQRSNEEILAAHPARQIAAAIARRQLARRRRWFVALPVMVLSVCAAAAVLLVRPTSIQKPDELSPEVITLKGQQPRLRIYRKDPAGPIRLGPNDRAKSGDTLQVAYLAAGRRFGVVASIDSRGAVSWHLSDGRGESPKLEPSGEHAVPASFELDAAPGTERFVFLASNQAFPVAHALRWLKQGEKPPQSIVLVEFVVKKELP